MYHIWHSQRKWCFKTSRKLLHHLFNLILSTRKPYNILQFSVYSILFIFIKVYYLGKVQTFLRIENLSAASSNLLSNAISQKYILKCKFGRSIEPTHCGHFCTVLCVNTVKQLKPLRLRASHKLPTDLQNKEISLKKLVSQ